jgi:hypothetical protein
MNDDVLDEVTAMKLRSMAPSERVEDVKHEEA